MPTFLLQWSKLLERLRCERYAETVCLNGFLNVTITRREVKTLNSKVTVYETLRELMRIQRLQLSK